MSWDGSFKINHPYLDAFLIGASFSFGVLVASGVGLLLAVTLINQGVLG